MNRKPTEKNAQLRAMGDLVDETIRLSHAFRRAEIDMHGEGESTEAERNMLFALTSDGPRAVPHLARTRSITRQRAQQIMNGLLGSGHVEKQPNPASEKSPLYDLTKTGRKVVMDMLRKERRLYRDFAEAIGLRKMRTTIAVLKSVREEMEQYLGS